MDKRLTLEKYEIIEDTIYIKSKNSEAVCPYCNTVSNKAHSDYEKSFQNHDFQKS
ncbi:hypothetical protein [Caloramator sp. E03]|uniref:hypothetical protein n=1 Tax=Caloramator sp. E03 TaxID=2576307 RepID=UPI00143D5208|nr:hypothetical protein [Caloramator sp. E03]